MNRTLASIASGGALLAVGAVIGVTVAASGSGPAKAPAVRLVQPAAATVATHHVVPPAKPLTVRKAARNAVRPADVPAPSSTGATVNDVSTPASDPSTGAKMVVTQGPGTVDQGGVLRLPPPVTPTPQPTSPYALPTQPTAVTAPSPSTSPGN